MSEIMRLASELTLAQFRLLCRFEGSNRIALNTDGEDYKNAAILCATQMLRYDGNVGSASVKRRKLDVDKQWENFYFGKHTIGRQARVAYAIHHKVLDQVTNTEEFENFAPSIIADCFKMPMGYSKRKIKLQSLLLTCKTRQQYVHNSKNVY